MALTPHCGHVLTSSVDGHVGSTCFAVENNAWTCVSAHCRMFPRGTPRSGIAGVQILDITKSLISAFTGLHFQWQCVSILVALYLCYYWT